jgi:NhaA family Na+:H+ antiporter
MTAPTPQAPEQLISTEAVSGIVVLLAALAALVWVNSSWRESYELLWHHDFPAGWATGISGPPLRFWVNDGLMTLFFLIVGIELKRELCEGALSGGRRAALPVLAAFGGIAAPALIYVALNPSGESISGWAVPTATDTAVAMGVLALLGRRVSPTLRILLLAIAVVDDVVAALVIVVFYTAEVDGAGLLAVALGIGTVLTLRRLGQYHAIAYVAPAILIWGGFLWTGLHPALAGVVLGLLTPLNTAGRSARAPVRRLEALLHPWVAFAVMPLFALANAGISVAGMSIDGRDLLVGLGVVLGLVVGKPLGIVLAVALGLWLRWVELPKALTLPAVIVIASLAGIGFTMAIFFAELAFERPVALATAKLGILIGSTTAALIGLTLGFILLRRTRSTITVSSVNRL